MYRLSLRRAAAPVVIAALVATSVSTAASAAPTVVPTVDAVALGRALAADTSWVVGSAFVYRAGPTSAGLVSGGVAGFPSSGEHATILSTGDVSLITTPNSSGSSGVSFGGPSRRGDSDFDVTELRVDLVVPTTANCLVGLDFRFLSEEYPEYVGSRFNDAFVAELDRSTWRTSGSEILAPDNFAFDPTGAPITINAVGTTSMTADEASGTTFDGATPMLTAATPLTPGPHSLYLTIFDQGDSIYDSAVLVDNLRLGRVSNLATDCRPGAQVAVDRSHYVALGDSYSSGFGTSPYFLGTNKDDGPNDCQRSTVAYGPLVADARGLDLDFAACQGGVTKDFYAPRADGAWGETAQLDHLTDDTGLVTLTIGGNDAKFADVLRDCIDGWELLPFNSCYKDDRVTAPVAEGFARLDGQADTPEEVKPLGALYGDIREKAPIATVVALGYPHFFPANGSDRTWLPGGRCEAVKKVDQRWMVEKIDELNAIVRRNALAEGFLYAEADFTGHELCGSTGDEWIYPLLSAGRVHPTAQGHVAMSEAVLTVLDDDGFTRYTLVPGQVVSHSFLVGPSSPFISVTTGWPGSDVSLALRSPSGKVYDRTVSGSDVARTTGATYEIVKIALPEAGEWTAVLTGEDVAASGEPVTLSTYVADPLNRRPAAAFSTRVDGDELVLDASGSADPDGTIAGFDWYITTADRDDVYQGSVLRVPIQTEARSITLVVTDDRGLTDFAGISWVPIDVKPGGDVNPVKLTERGVTPIALLSTADFDATSIDPRTLAVGPLGAAVRETSAVAEDVDGDGRPDQVVHVKTNALGLTMADTQLCIAGTLPDSARFRSCDRIRPQ